MTGAVDYIDQFNKDALCTESCIDRVVVNKLLLESTMQGAIASLTVLDLIKKNVYYDREIDATKLLELALKAKTCAQSIIENIDCIHDRQPISTNPRVFHAIIGIATESAELLEALPLDDTPIDMVNVGEEFADVCWYGSLLLDEIKMTWQRVMTTVILKLKLRFPDKFNKDRANSRNLDAERQVLEGGMVQDTPYA
jgi:hypothetical protein